MRLVLGGLAIWLLMLRECDPACYASRREAITVAASFQEATSTSTALVLAIPARMRKRGIYQLTPPLVLDKSGLGASPRSW
jgi:hypothetical protein